jgi:hypothetical protein
MGSYYPLVPDDSTASNIPAPEEGTSREGEYFAGNDEDSPEESRAKGVQPGYDTAGISPMSNGFWSAFGPFPNQPS